MDQLLAYLLTLATEVPLVCAVRRTALRGPHAVNNTARHAWVAAAASSLTHPVAWKVNDWLAWNLPHREAIRAYLVLEGAVLAVEALVLLLALGWSWRLAGVASALSNTVSASVGWCAADVLRAGT